MDRLDTTPTFNLKVVVQETGLRPDTLRAWERRYGLPQPDRSGGGHRLYSRHDIEILKWLKAREAEGMSISRAVDLWRRLLAEGRDPLEAELGAPSGRAPGTFLPADLSGQSTALSQLRQAWLAAALAFDERSAEQILTQAFALYPPEVVCSEVLQQGVRDAGAGWCRGEVTVQQEHYTTELAVRRLEALQTASPPPTRQQRVLVACAPHEDHAFSPLLFTFLLRRRGLDVEYLGANVPAQQLEATLSAARPQLVVLAAQRLPTAATLADAARAARQAHAMVGYGGAVFNRFPGLRSRIAGHFLGEDLNQAADAVDRLLAAPPLLPPLPPPVSNEYRHALAHFHECQARIEAHVCQAAQDTPVLAAHLSDLNASVARNIGAALALGDINVAEAEVMWKECLPDELRLPGQVAARYLDLYHAAAQAELDERGAMVVEQLDRMRSPAL